MEKLDLPGISQIELTAALLEAGVKTNLQNPQSNLSASDIAEEAELWSALNGSEMGTQNFDPFVNLSLKWNFNVWKVNKWVFGAKSIPWIMSSSLNSKQIDQILSENDAFLKSIQEFQAMGKVSEVLE